jgi:pimeloyl-ACP methyl ester carboxylesterase
MGYTSLSPIEFTLRAHKDVPAGMIDVPQHVGAGSADYFWIDKFEVTNREFKRFVDLGGYARPGHWTAALAETGSLTFETAQRTFRDRTGRPGPAGWELGTYTERTDDHPVGGVSWYEAAAYCTFAGKHLPSADHWRAAAAFEATSDFAWHGRFGADGPAPVGGPLALGYYGTYDMAGNVKEWTWNRVAGDRRRYVLGGGWNEPTYAFAMIDAQPPAERLPAYGFRCAKYVGAIDPALLAPIPELAHDFRHDTPVDDKTFAMIRRWYQYDAGSLDARLERHQPLFDGVRVEQVSFTAAYGNDRVPALLFLPTRGAPPYQAVVYLPAVNVMSQPGPFGFVEGEQHWFMFLVRSGRAVIVPIYYGAFGRGTPQIRHGDTSPGLRSQEVVTRASMDVGRTVDYLATRRDIDASRLAFFGLSSSAALGPLVTAMEPRFKVSILLGGGLWDSGPPETSSFNFLPRVTAATLMINGRHDFIFPPETSQIPMFERLGTTDKKHTVFESGHLPNEWHEVMKAALDWLDGHLGSVAQVGAGP